MFADPLARFFSSALAYFQAGRLAESENLCRQILAHNQSHADTLHLLGLIFCQTGRMNDAVVLMQRSIALTPESAGFHSNLGAALSELGRPEEAIVAFQQAIALQPGLAETHSNLGGALHKTGRDVEAIAAYRKAVGLKPDSAEIQSNLGNLLREQRQAGEAIEVLQRAASLQPNDTGVHNDLGNALRDARRPGEAVVSYRRAIRLNPGNAMAHSNLGVLLFEEGFLVQGLATLQRSIALDSQFAAAHGNLGFALRELGELDEAIEEYRQAIALQPASALNHALLGHALRDQGRLDEAISCYRQAMALDPSEADFHSSLAFILHYHPQFDAQAIASEHRRWGETYGTPLGCFIPAHGNEATAGRRLRIGYVSPDFREHPVGRFLWPLLREHDRERFEIFCYSMVPRPDAMTQSLRAQSDHWHDLTGLDDEQAARLIREHEIDILVDLALHTTRNRLLLFARKPAPVQVTYLAYAGTSGLSTMDYRLSDPFIDPPGVDESVYEESTMRLPQTYWCFQPGDAPPLSPPPSLGNGRVTFGCLNNFSKVSTAALQTWAGLLKAVPSARLLLYASEGFHRQQTAERLQQWGIDPSRVDFIERKSMTDYLQLYARIDVALDPFPYGGGMTTCDALWMGVPVVSLCGQTAVGRGGASILSNVGLGDLVAGSEEDYIRIAAQLAHDSSRLQDLRMTLRERMQSSPLMDAPGFARDVEGAYQAMWDRWRATRHA